MVSKEVTILNATGLHARPASMFVQTAGKFKSDVSVIKDGNTINAKNTIITIAKPHQLEYRNDIGYKAELQTIKYSDFGKTT